MVTCNIILCSLALLFSKCQSQVINKLDSKEENLVQPPVDNNTPVVHAPKPVMDLNSPWSLGIVPYYVDPESYDNVIEDRIHSAMELIERSSCLIFNHLHAKPLGNSFMWLHFTNPQHERDCVHQVHIQNVGEIVVTLGFECMMPMNIIHTILLALGFNHEVTHPQRDKYIRILWENIQPKYRFLFLNDNGHLPNRPVVEYDPQSVMHFHDRAFSVNGEATIAPLIPGLIIQPSEKLSQLDKMKLKLYFSHECNQRKVDNLIDDCRNLLLGKTDTGKPYGNNTEPIEEVPKEEITDLRLEEDLHEDDDDEGEDQQDEIRP